MRKDGDQTQSRGEQQILRAANGHKTTTVAQLLIKDQKTNNNSEELR